MLKLNLAKTSNASIGEDFEKMKRSVNDGIDDSDDYFYISDNDNSNYDIRIFSSYLFVVFDLVFRQVNVQLS